MTSPGVSSSTTCIRSQSHLKINNPICAEKSTVIFQRHRATWKSHSLPSPWRKVAPKITSKRHSLCRSTPYVRERSLVCINKSLSDPANSTYRNVEHTCSGQRAIHCCGYTVWQTLTHSQKVKITWTIYR